jgi:DNA repair exonuclease SbcCD ATPase subunit
MAEKRKDLEANLAKLSQVRDRIIAQLEEAENRVGQLQIIVNSEMMETGNSNSLQELTNTREKATSLHSSLKYANSQVNAARQTLNDYDQAARGGQVMELDKKLMKAVADLQPLIGEDGLHGKLDGIYEMILEMERLQAEKVFDCGQHLQIARSIYIDLSRSLATFWSRFEELKWGPQHGTNSPKPGYLPGFGRIPGY